MSDLADPIVLGIMFIVFVVGCVIAFEVFSLMPDFGQPAMKTEATNFYGAINLMGIFIVIALVSGTIGSAYLIRTNPLFLGVSIILLVVQFAIMPMLVNVFNPIFQAMPTGANEFDLLIWMVQLSPITSFVAGLFAAIVGMRAE